MNDAILIHAERFLSATKGRPMDLVGEAVSLISSRGDMKPRSIEATELALFLLVSGSVKIDESSEVENA